MEINLMEHWDALKRVEPIQYLCLDCGEWHPWVGSRIGREYFLGPCNISFLSCETSDNIFYCVQFWKEGEHKGQCHCTISAYTTHILKAVVGSHEFYGSDRECFYGYTDIPPIIEEGGKMVMTLEVDGPTMSTGLSDHKNDSTANCNKCLGKDECRVFPILKEKILLKFEFDKSELERAIGDEEKVKSLPKTDGLLNKVKGQDRAKEEDKTAAKKKPKPSEVKGQDRAKEEVKTVAKKKPKPSQGKE